MSESDSPGVFLPPPLLFAAAVAAGLPIDGELQGWANVSRPAQFAGLAVALAGLALIVLSLGLFRRFRTRPEPWQPSSAQITSGFYRLSHTRCISTWPSLRLASRSISKAWPPRLCSPL